MQFRYVPEAQARGQFVAQETRCMIECRHRLFLLPLSAAYRDFYRSMFAVGADVDVDYLDRQKARIGGFKPNQLR